MLWFNLACSCSRSVGTIKKQAGEEQSLIEKRREQDSSCGVLPAFFIVPTDGDPGPGIGSMLPLVLILLRWGGIGKVLKKKSCNGNHGIKKSNKIMLSTPFLSKNNGSSSSSCYL